MDKQIGFIGLGNLGLPVAANLLDEGYELRVYNRTASKAEPLVAKGATSVQQPADTITPGGVVVSLLWDGASVESVISSEGFLERLGPNGIHISMSTILPDDAKKLAALHAQYGSIYIEAPIFGRPEAAAARELWMPYAGPKEAKERIEPLLKAMGAKGVFDFGEEIGAATLVKIVGNYLIVSATRSLTEGLTIARQSGVDPMAVVNMLTQTLFPAPIYQTYGKRIAQQAVSFSQNAIPIKDVGLFQHMAQQVDVSTPIAHVLSELLRSNS